jgi:hypothetical protein
VPQPPVNRAPTAAFTATPTSGIAPLTVDFDASSSSDADGTVTSHSWNFGDGSQSVTGAVTSHTFTASAAGARYSVRLTVQDDDGTTAIKDAEIRVAPPLGSFTLSGTVQIRRPARSTATSTTSDDAGFNDDFDAAQALPNPATLGGYLTRPGAGEAGSVRDNGDLADFFRVSLSGNETLLVTVGEPSNDTALSLQLYDADLALVDAVPGITESASITASAPGTYYIGRHHRRCQPC